MKRINKKGISLIVLVITIIVMIILASAVILSINNTGIIRKANTAVDMKDSKDVEQLIAIAWSEAYMEGARTKEELEAKISKKLEGIKLSGYEYSVTEKGVNITQTIKRNENNALNSKLNSYGFYFDVAYEMPLYFSGVGPGAIVFHEDGSAEVYMSLSGVTYGIQTCNYVYSAGSITYEKGKIIFPDTYFTSDALIVKDKGLTLASTSDTLECYYKVSGAVKYNSVYQGVDFNTNKPVTAIFKDANTLEIKYFETAESTSATTVTLNITLDGHGHMIKVNGDSYNGVIDCSEQIAGIALWSWKQDAFGYISLDGESIVIAGNSRVPYAGTLTLVSGIN